MLKMKMPCGNPHGNLGCVELRIKTNQIIMTQHLLWIINNHDVLIIFT
jgi:hypothetical protein